MLDAHIWNTIAEMVTFGHLREFFSCSERDDCGCEIRVAKGYEQVGNGDREVLIIRVNRHYTRLDDFSADCVEHNPPIVELNMRLRSHVDCERAIIDELCRIGTRRMNDAAIDEWMDSLYNSRTSRTRQGDEGDAMDIAFLLTKEGGRS